MKSETRNILLKAYAELHKIIQELYEAHDRAMILTMLVCWLVEQIDFMKKSKI